MGSFVAFSFTGDFIQNHSISVLFFLIFFKFILKEIMNKLKILHVVPTLKKDGAEVQLLNYLKRLIMFILNCLHLIYMKMVIQFLINLENINIYSESFN